MTHSIKTAAPPVQELFEKASQSRQRAYAPYSGHWVGSAIRTSNGQIYSGCNVENSSYGGSICAERVAIFKAVSEQGRFQIQEVMVVTDADPAWPPCGMCRQVIAEFGTDCTIYICNIQGQCQKSSLRELFPRAFTPNHLNANG